jgi:hypothetical protein
MYRIMLRDARITLASMLALGHEDPDAALALCVAIDQDALAKRLLDCADARLSNARYARTPGGALIEANQALALWIKAIDARQFADRMLDAAIVFEAASGSYRKRADVGEATKVWGDLMTEGIFG